MTKKFLKGFILITFGVLIVGVLVNAAQYYRVNNGTTATINEWSVCKKVTNNTGKDIFVPTNTSNEWNQFRTYFPSGISLGNCWACGDPVTFTYRGSQVTYGTVSHNNECWMDRNLGASRVAQSSTDSSAYGDLFQWGRLADGHQDRTSLVTTILSSSDNPGHSKFISVPDAPRDWRSPRNDNLWQGVDGINNPCPSGWRVPTKDEWETERLSWSSNNPAGAYASPLKLTLAGYRSFNGGQLLRVGDYAEYWSSTIDGTNSFELRFFDDTAYVVYAYRAHGHTVRCIKD